MNLREIRQHRGEIAQALADAGRADLAAIFEPARRGRPRGDVEALADLWCETRDRAATAGKESTLAEFESDDRIKHVPDEMCADRDGGT